MKHLLLLLIVLCAVPCAALETVSHYDGDIVPGPYDSRPIWEESAYIEPGAPCIAKELYVYLTGDQPATDTLYLTGDPSEGNLPGTFWVISYNMLADPIIIDYDGKPGWDTIPINDLWIDGYQRVCVQHRLKANGPWFALDGNGCTEPLRAYLLDPESENDYGWPGIAYRASGDYIIGMGVEFMEKGEIVPPVPKLLDVTEDIGLVNDEGNVINSQRVSVADWNSDGFDDIAFASYMFQNNTRGGYDNVTEQMNIQAQTTVWFDYDNDGDVDCYAIYEAGINQEMVFVNAQNTIYRNDDGVFTRLDPKQVFLPPYPNPCDEFEIEVQYENDSIHNPYVCWAPLSLDYDNDGDMDLYFGNRRSAGSYPGEIFNPDKLWRNNGDGTFSDVTKESGIFELCKHKSGEGRNQENLYFNGQDAAACDFNNDGLIDIHMINYGLERDFLYKNNGDGTFSDVAAEKGLDGSFWLNPNPDASTHGHAVEWADFNNDGYPEPFVGNLAHPDWRGLFSNPSMIYKNSGPPDYTFTQVQHEMGLRFTESDCGVIWADFDLDGWQDIWYGQRYDKLAHVYMNQGAPDFKLKEETWALGSVVHDTWTGARLDYDNDGDMDLLTKGRLFRNDMNRGNNWLTIVLGGSPADGVPNLGFGTKVYVYCGDLLFYRDLMGATGGPRHRQNSNDLNFGIGQNSQIDSVVVTYPNGEKNVIKEGIPVNGKYLLPYMGSFIGNAVSMCAPQLIAPDNYSFGHETSLNMQWAPSEAAINYVLEIANDKEFTDYVVQNNQISALEYDCSGLEENRSYYWRLKAEGATASSQWAGPWVFTTGRALPMQAALAAPADASISIGLLPGLSWHPADYAIKYAPNIKYRVELATDENFENMLAEFTDITDTNLVLTDMLPVSTYIYWRVAALNGTRAGQWSETWTFTTMPLPDAPIMSEPGDGATEIKTRPWYKWEAVNIADYYDLQVSKTEDFAELVYEETEIEYDKFRTSTKLDEGTVHYWRIRSCHEGGCSDWTNPWSFTVEGEISVYDQIGIGAEMIIRSWPNPASSQTLITLETQKTGEIEIFVSDMLGTCVLNIYSGRTTAYSNEYDIDTSELDQGIYLLTARSASEQVSCKLIIIR